MTDSSPADDTRTPRERLDALGWRTAGPMRAPPGVTLPFVPCRRSGNLLFVSGHLPLEPDGSVAGPRGRVGGPVDVEAAALAARRVALAMFGTLERELGSLERVGAWVRVFGMVNQVDGFDRQPAVINGFSEAVLEAFGPDVGAHPRSAIGVAGLPFDVPVEVEATVELRD